MDKYKSLILLVAGLAVALITSFLTYNWLQSKADAKTVTPMKTQKIAIATVDLNWGAVLNNDNVKMVPYLKKSLPQGHFTEKAALEGRVLINPVKADEPIFESSLAPVDVSTGGVAAVINPEKRAMAVKVDKVIGVSGFIYPGHKVDVLVTLKGKAKKGAITKTVLEDILVLAIGTKAEKDPKTQKAIRVDVITLEVTPTEAEKLAFAASNGKVVLAMRNFQDKKKVYTKGTNRKTLLASYSTKSSGKSYKRKRIPTYTVEIIRGTKVSKVKVSGR
jgi:pilus assembly protein CpaB